MQLDIWYHLSQWKNERENMLMVFMSDKFSQILGGMLTNWQR